MRRLLGQDALANLGQVYLAEYLEALGQARPLVLLLEDLHWADDRSLDALLALAAPGRLAAPLLAIGLVRPAFFERRRIGPKARRRSPACRSTRSRAATAATWWPRSSKRPSSSRTACAI